jgi:hypothetical protein
MFFARVRSLSIILEDVDVCLPEHDVTGTQEKNLVEILDSCSRVLEDTRAALNQYHDLRPEEQSLGKRVKKAWKQLNWEPDDIKDLRSRITSNTTLLNAFYEGYTRENIAKVMRRQDQQEHQAILDWLSPTDYATQQSDFVNREPGTGKWLLESAEYLQWVARKEAMLFCPGIPGAGKTILTSIVVDHLRGKFGTDTSTGICYIYFNFRRKNEQRLDGILLSLVKQLSQRQPSLPQSVRNLYFRHKKTLTRPSTSDICQTLKSVVAGLSRVFVVVDALDECQVLDGCRSMFISELLDLRSWIGANILVTSRFIPEISERFCEGTTKDIRAADNDISKYLDSNLAQLPGFVSNNTNLQSEIKENISTYIPQFISSFLQYLGSLS